MSLTSHTIDDQVMDTGCWRMRSCIRGVWLTRFILRFVQQVAYWQELNLSASSTTLSAGRFMRTKSSTIFLFVRFADDGANFSINTDDSMVTGTWTEQEYELLRWILSSDWSMYNNTDLWLVRSWGFKESHLIRANVNAMKASFLPESEKQELLKKLYEAYDIEI